jgi:hypothetical protein
MALAPEREQQADRGRGVVDRDLLARPKVEEQPAGGEASVSLRVALCDQRRELQCLDQRQPSHLARGDLREDEVPAVDRSAENRSRVAVRGQASPSSGPSRRAYSLARRSSDRERDRLGVAERRMIDAGSGSER